MTTAPPELTASPVPMDPQGSPAAAPAKPADPPPLRMLSDLLAQVQGGSAESRAQAEQALLNISQESPHIGAAHMGLGLAVAMRGELTQAGIHFAKAVAVDPKLASAWSNLGNIHKLQGRLKEAARAYRQAIAAQPDQADAHYNLALVLDAEGLSTEAEESLRRALLFRPGYPEVHNNLGHMALKGGKVEQAVSHFRQALVFNPGLKPARHNLIFALYRLGRSTEAQAEVDGILADHPEDPQVLRVQAAGLAQQGRLGDAEVVNRKLLELQPDAPDLQMNLGEVMLQRDDYEGALACYRRLLNHGQVPPAVTIGAMGNVMQAQGNHSEARNLYQQALMMDPNRASLQLGLTRALLDAGETRQGLETLRRSVALLPQSAEVHSQLLLAMRLDAQCGPHEHRAEAARWQAAHASQSPAAVARRSRKSGEPLRVGLLVGNLETGPVGPALVCLLPLLDAKKMDIIVYHAGRAGPIAVALQALASRWRPMAPLGNADVTEQMRQDVLDVLVDMVGHEAGSRLAAISERVAPVQLAWLGDFDDSGLAAMDGLLQDAVLAAGKAGDGAVNAVMLPALLPWAAPADAPECGSAPSAAMGHVTFGVVSPLSHIQAVALDAWAQILLAVPGAKLLILTATAPADEATRARLQRLLLLRDVAPERVEIVCRLSALERMHAMARMDVVLDTFPAPWGLDALSALWMGVPVITLQGTAAWQRTTQSVLVQAGLSDWVAPSREAYIQRAVEVAGQAQVLADLRQQLRARLQAAPVMGHQQFARAFESALLRACDAGAG